MYSDEYITKKQKLVHMPRSARKGTRQSRKSFTDPDAKVVVLNGSLRLPMSHVNVEPIVEKGQVKHKIHIFAPGKKDFNGIIQGGYGGSKKYFFTNKSFRSHPRVNLSFF